MATDAFIEWQNPPHYYSAGGVVRTPVRAGEGGDFWMEIHFSKLQENGNDFIVIDEYERLVIPDEMKGQFAAIYCDRKFGIGADGVVYVMKSESCDLRIRILLPDESESVVPGNGIRCLARYAFDAGYVKETCTVETPGGVIRVSMGYRDEDFVVTVTMNPPKFDRKEIPATGSGDYRENIGGFEVHAVNTGLPHAVIIVDSVDAVDIETAAPEILHHATFPEGANVNFVESTGSDSIRIRTFECGTEAETLSCATGAAASAAIVTRLGLAGNDVDVETRGGPLTIHAGDSFRIEGPATTVFSGSISF